MRHTISNVNKDKLEGYCQVCGSDTPLVVRDNKYYRCRIHIREQKKQWAQKTYSSTENRETWLKNKYNISSEVFDSIFKSQGLVCAVCKSPEPVGKGWHIDHNHLCCSGRKSCGKCIRGILCSNCNTALGLLKDDTERLKNAIDYLS